MFEWNYTTVTSKIQKYLGKASGWIIDSVMDHYINISKNNPLAGSGYIKLPNKLNNTKKVWLIFKILMIMIALNSI